MIYEYKLDIIKDGISSTEVFNDFRDACNYIETENLSQDQVDLFQAVVTWKPVPLNFTMVRRYKVRKG